MVFANNRMKNVEKKKADKRKNVKNNNRKMKRRLKQYINQEDRPYLKELKYHFLHGCKNRKPNFNIPWSDNLGMNLITNLCCGPINDNVMIYGFPSKKCKECCKLWSMIQNKHSINMAESIVENCVILKNHDTNLYVIETHEFYEKLLDIYNFGLNLNYLQ
jgi:hypothetical protein